MAKLPTSPCLRFAPLALALGLAAIAPAARAGGEQEAMQKFLETTIMGFAENSVIVDAIKAQNAETGDYDQAKIDALDKRWRAEVNLAEQPTIAPVLNNPASDFLRQQVAAADGAISEIFVTDAKGLNVATSGVTSDYWQGDEAKFTNTYPLGPDATHYGDIEFDESANSYEAQISLTLTDPATGEAIGTMTVGVNAKALF